MSISEVLDEEDRLRKDRIEVLKKKVKDWIIGAMKDVEHDRKAFPELVDCSYEEDVADDMLQTFIDFEFQQLETLTELSKELEADYDNHCMRVNFNI